MKLIIEELRGWTEFIQMQEPWNQLLSRSHAPKIFFCWEWYYLWLKHFWYTKDFHFLLVRDESRGLRGIVPLIMKQSRDGVVVEFIGDTNTWDYRDAIIDQAMIEPVLVSILNYLKEKIKDFDFETQKIDELRKVRNEINYRGLTIKKDYLERNELEFKNIIKRLKEELG